MYCVSFVPNNLFFFRTIIICSEHQVPGPDTPITGQTPASPATDDDDAPDLKPRATGDDDTEDDDAPDLKPRANDDDDDAPQLEPRVIGDDDDVSPFVPPGVARANPSTLSFASQATAPAFALTAPGVAHANPSTQFTSLESGQSGQATLSSTSEATATVIAPTTPLSKKSSAVAASSLEAQSPLKFGLKKGGGVVKQKFNPLFVADEYPFKHSVLAARFLSKKLGKTNVLKYYCDAATYFAVQISNVCKAYLPDGSRQRRSYNDMLLFIDHCKKQKEPRKSNDFYFEQLNSHSNVSAVCMFIEFVLRPAITQAASSTTDHNWIPEDD
jgi:hypothetical protein